MKKIMNTKPEVNVSNKIDFFEKEHGNGNEDALLRLVLQKE